MHNESDDFEDLGQYARNRFSESELRLHFGLSPGLRHYRLQSRSTSSPLAPAGFCPLGKNIGLRFVPPRSASILGDIALPRRYSSYRLVQTPRTYNFHLSNHPLFISIWQIFDDIFASENKVFEATFSIFFRICRNLANFQKPQNVLRELELEVLLKH